MKIKILYANEQSKQKAGWHVRRLIRRAVAGALSYEHFTRPVTVSVTFTDNEGIRVYNNEYRQIDRATDVLSFPMYDFKNGDEPEEGEPVCLGDIVLSLERAAEQAVEFGHSYEREVAFLTVHSVLHLLGYDHMLSDEDDRDMRRRQRDIMTNIHLLRE